MALVAELSAMQTGHEAKTQSYKRPVSVLVERHLGKHRDADCSKAPGAAEETAATKCCRLWAKAGKSPSQGREDCRNICWELYKQNHDTASHARYQRRVASCRYYPNRTQSIPCDKGIRKGFKACGTHRPKGHSILRNQVLQREGPSADNFRNVRRAMCWKRMQASGRTRQKINQI